MNNLLAVAIPTCAKNSRNIRIGYVLESLALQVTSEYFKGFDIYIRDEGMAPITGDRWTQLAIDLCIKRGHKVTYLRRQSSSGVAAARRDLLEEIPADHEQILMLDDDLIVMPGAVNKILAKVSEMEEYGFIQGTKLELDEKRSYHNDINKLNQPESDESLRRIWFGDAAFLLLNRKALQYVNWDIVTRFTEENLPGEDVSITLMIADKMPCYGLPAATGYHMSLAESRWHWEVPSDLLQIELLQETISTETLRKALPHLGKYLKDDPSYQQATGRDFKEEKEDS